MLVAGSGSVGAGEYDHALGAGALTSASRRILAARAAQRESLKTSLVETQRRSKVRQQQARIAQVDRWRRKTERSPFTIDLLAEQERIDEENRVRVREEARRQKLLQKRREEVKAEIIIKALTEENDISALRAEKRAIQMEERRLKALLELERARLHRKADLQAAMRAERQRHRAKREYRRDKFVALQRQREAALRAARMEKEGLIEDPRDGHTVPVESEGGFFVLDMLRRQGRLPDAYRKYLDPADLADYDEVVAAVEAAEAEEDAAAEAEEQRAAAAGSAAPGAVTNDGRGRGYGRGGGVAGAGPGMGMGMGMGLGEVEGLMGPSRAVSAGGSSDYEFEADHGDYEFEDDAVGAESLAQRPPVASNGGVGRGPSGAAAGSRPLTAEELYTDLPDDLESGGGREATRGEVGDALGAAHSSDYEDEAYDDEEDLGRDDDQDAKQEYHDDRGRAGDGQPSAPSQAVPGAASAGGNMGGASADTGVGDGRDDEYDEQFEGE